MTNKKDILAELGDEIPQFAPNFSVYLLQTDLVCLYSEDRKFLLHGELYGALATMIAKGGKNFQKLARELEKTYPADMIRHALTRMLERRYILPASRASRGEVAAFWASLGFSPETGAENLENCRVRLQSLDVEGATELEAALKAHGVRVVKRGGDLTVTLVGDYLDPRLEELNQQRLAEGAPWALIHPAGVFPLVGPVFRPGESACWKCLSDRMRLNREVRSLLDRKGARRLTVSPLAQRPFGQAGVELAAVEIAKAIGTGFRTELSDHVISLDLLGASVAKHYVGRRPQCPACGKKKLRDPRRAPAPIELGADNKVVLTSGGYRSVAPSATVARFSKHVSPLTGVVSKLERIEADLPLNTNWQAQHNFTGGAETVGELRQGLQGGSFGKGSTAEQGQASALMEAIERYSGIFQGDEIRAPRRFLDFKPGEAIAPNDVLNFSEAQLRRGADPSSSHEDVEATPALFDAQEKFDWSPLWSLRDKAFKYLPTTMLYFFYRGPAAFAADSNGCAAGNTVAEAIVQGFLELVERDSYALWWYNRVQRPELDLSHFEDSYVREFRNELADRGHRLWVLDITSDLGIPTYVAITHWMKDGKENIEFGSGAHFDARIALLRALTELNQFLSIVFMGGGTGDKSSLDGVTPLRLQDYPYLTPNGAGLIQPDLDVKFGKLATHEQVDACVALVEKAGHDFLVLDQTRADIGVPVVRVVVPGLRHFYRRFGPGRLYDVPVSSGWLEAARQEADLNPIHPHS